jgi:group I intron endonuclease
MLPTSSGVYCIISLATGRRYIGSAKKFNVRWTAHRYLLVRNKHHSPQLQYEWNKYGEQAFRVIVIEECPTTEMVAREQFWLDAWEPEMNAVKTATSPSLDAGARTKIAAASKRRGEKYEIGGALMSVSDILTQFGIGHVTFYSRLTRGWSVEDAAKTPANQARTYKGAKTLLYKGTLYTFTELAKMAHCSKTALWRRVKAGVPIEEAVEMTPEQAELRRRRLISVAQTKKVEA